MPFLSSDQMWKEWVYAIKQDFQSADGTPATYPPGAPLHWDCESAKIQPKQGARYEHVSVNSDATLLAVAVENDIYIYNTEGLGLRQVLKGHTSPVDSIVFQPEHSHKLVSFGMNTGSSRNPEEPCIIFWDLDDPSHQHPLETEGALRTLAGRAVSGIVAGLEDSGSKWQLNDEEKGTLIRNIQSCVTILNVRYAARDLPRIHGRLIEHFQSGTFSHDGRSMIYLPGQSPRSNSEVPWDICVLDTVKHELRLTLEGHTDAIMWTGFSHDNQLIASVCWDKTIRIWNSETGALVHTFVTKGQNWTGTFSPDSRYFAGTCGTGDVYIWDLKSGGEIASYHYGNWCRAVDWSPDGKNLIIGGKGLGRIVVFDVQTQKVLQERILSTEASPEEHRVLMPSFLEVQALKFLPGGRKFAFQTSGDNGVEVYDFVSNRKWRFAPKRGQATAHGWGFVFLPRQGKIVSVDGDALRVWDLPSDEGDDWNAPALVGGRNILVENSEGWMVMH